MSNRKLMIRYTKDPEFRNLHIDGVYGGVTNTSALAVAFFSETGSLPVSEELTVDEGGRITEAKANMESFSHDRVLHSQVIMSLEVAEVLYRWLGDRLKSSKTNEKLQ